MAARAGEMLRQWRQQRRLSQLDLSFAAEVSAKHLSYIETGRTRPSREMIAHLCSHLDVPLRERNSILLAAGHAPQHLDLPLDRADSSGLHDLIDLIVSSHRYPTLVVDRQWNLVAANRPAELLTVGAAPHLLEPPVNVLRLTLHPDGIAPRIINFAEYANHIVNRVRRRMLLDPDRAAQDLLDEFGDLAGRASTNHSGIALPLHLQLDSGAVQLVSTIATFGSPHEVSLSELAIESLYPADATSGQILDAAIAMASPAEHEGGRALPGRPASSCW